VKVTRRQNYFSYSVKTARWRCALFIRRRHGFDLRTNDHTEWRLTFSVWWWSKR